MTLNITPGPLLFNERPEVVWGLIETLLIANFVLLILNVPLVKYLQNSSVPASFLLPGVAMVSFVGIYSLSGSYFDLFNDRIWCVRFYFTKIKNTCSSCYTWNLLGGHMK